MEIGIFHEKYGSLDYLEIFFDLYAFFIFIYGIYLLVYIKHKPPETFEKYLSIRVPNKIMSMFQWEDSVQLTIIIS